MLRNIPKHLTSIRTYHPKAQPALLHMCFATSLNMIFKFFLGRELGGSSSKWRHLVLEACRLLSLCLVVPSCWRRFITSLNKSRLHQNPIFCPIFSFILLVRLLFQFLSASWSAHWTKRRQISIRRQVYALWPTGWSRFPYKPTYKMSVIDHRKRFYLVLKNNFP